MDRKHKDRLLSYALIRFVALPAAFILTAIILVVFLYFRIFSELTAIWILLAAIIIESISWIIWTIRSVRRSDKEDRFRLWIINAIIVMMYAGCLAFGYDRIFGYKLEMKEKSPCRNYTVEVYIPRMRFAMPGDGGFYSNPTRIKLKNKWGWTIGESDESNSPFYGDLEFEWDYENKCFWYARGSAIDF